MARRGLKSLRLHVEQDVQWVGGYDDMDQDRAEVEQMFYGMHRQAGPRPNIDVAMMKCMHPAIQWTPVDQPVNPVKMK